MKTLLAVCWVVGWAAATAAFDVDFALRCHRQWRASSFPIVKGVVTHSHIVVKEGGKGPTTYGVEVSYEYAVNNVRYTGGRYRYGATYFYGDYAREAVAQLHLQSPVDVYYDPANPAESSLHAQLLGADFSESIFLLFFNFVAVGMLTAAAYSLKEKLRGAVFRLRSVERLGVTQLNIAAISPIATTILTGLGLSIALLIPLGAIEHMKIDPPLQLFGGMWGVFVVVLASTYAFSRFARIGNQELIVNGLTGEITLPRGFGRAAAIVVHRDKIEAFDVEEATWQDRRGRQRSCFYPTISFKTTEGATRRERLAEWFPRERAERFTRWLRSNVLLRLDPESWRDSSNKPVSHSHDRSETRL